MINLNITVQWLCFATALLAWPLTVFPSTEKPTCAVLTFDAKAGIAKDEAEILTERFAVEFGKLAKYRLISRSKMKEVFELQKFSRSDNCSATECAIEAGKILSAQFMVYGAIGKVGNTYSVNVALVSVETGEITSQGSVDVEGKVDDLLKTGMLNAARQLAGLESLISASPRAETPADVRSASKATLGQPLTIDLGGGVTMEFAWIPPGEFMMGSNDGESDEKPAHRVKITTGFWMGKYEVAQAQWEKVMKNNPSNFKGANLPVETVSWNDCQEFIGQMNNLIASSAFAGLRRDEGNRNLAFRLPSEAEWEYACRAGTTTKYYTGNSESDMGRMGWYNGNSGSKTHLVGGKEPNAWGLFDMHGNVWEWCADWYAGYSGDTQDPVGPSLGSVRVLRGGSWFFSPVSCRSAYRCWYSPVFAYSNYGFRVVVCRR